MKIVTNHKYIRRNKKIGQYTTIASLAILVIGFIISLDTSNPSLFTWSLLALIVGFILSQVGIYFGNRWGRSPRPDEVLATGLKGLEDKYVLYNYMTVTPHLLVGPAGIWILSTFTQRGSISYDAQKKRWNQRGGNFLVWRQGEDYCLQLSGDILAGVLKRLSMFILRAKVQGRDASDETVRLVVAGPHAASAVSAAMGTLPEAAMRSMASDAGQAIRVGDDKFVLSVAPERAAAAWQALRTAATPVGAPVWDWLRLNAGIPMIVAATQEQFVPQMVNLEAIGGVSFQKGCYPGQEIVARSQYLGKLKRRMFLAHVEAAAAPGDNLYSADLAGQATGTVVNAAPAPSGGFDVLAVAQVESANTQTLHLNAADGAALRLKPLPYALPD
ncbi:MAG TPA: folate-binding protein [Thiobacillus sp.]